MPTDHLSRPYYQILCLECKKVSHYSLLEAVHQTKMHCLLCSEMMYGSDYYERPKVKNLLKGLDYSGEHISPNEVVNVDEAMELDFQKAFIETR